jgi:endonuclease YncB( thermonuclease family)
MIRFALILILLAAPLTASADIVGKARAVDGDTLDMAGTLVHLYAIDAPEETQTCAAAGKTWHCGREATFALAAEAGDHWITCKVMETLAPDRFNAICYAGPYDLGTIMIRRGLALARPEISARYVEEERLARTDRRGVWKGDVIAPWEWRVGKRFGARD